MVTDQSGKSALGEHRMRNALTVAAVVLTPSVLLVLLGLNRPPG